MECCTVDSIVYKKGLRDQVNLSCMSGQGWILSDVLGAVDRGERAGIGWGISRAI